MKISGLMKTTLLDFPETLACTVFTGGCNFRCPFCYNSGLIFGDAGAFMSAEEFFAFLRKRARTLEGVAISGGEPTLQNDLPEFIFKIKKDFGLKVKLDTNGSNPDMLKFLIDEGLTDYVAMDIKAGPSGYPRLTGLDAEVCAPDGPAAGARVPDGPAAGTCVSAESAVETCPCDGVSSGATEKPAAVTGIPEKPAAGAGIIGSVTRSKDMLINLLPGSAYEFRTTVVGGLHKKEDFEEIGRFIRGAGKYVLQRYQDNEHVLERNRGFYPPDIEDMKIYMEIVRPSVGSVELRGVDLFCGADP